MLSYMVFKCFKDVQPLIFCEVFTETNDANVTFHSLTGTASRTSNLVEVSGTSGGHLVWMVHGHRSFHR